MSELFMIKKHWNAVKYRIALIFPSLRAISYYSLGFQILYRMLNSYPDVLAERFTYDSIYSIESFRPLNEFDIV
ncbi:MAG: B12-binding domain-containing radical SAM protein, partial [Thermoprotei archaeon]